MDSLRPHRPSGLATAFTVVVIATSTFVLLVALHVAVEHIARSMACFGVSVR